MDFVIARIAEYCIKRAFTGKDNVVAIAAANKVVIFIVDNEVIAVTAEEMVITLAALDIVIAGSGVDRVITVASDKVIVTGTARYDYMFTNGGTGRVEVIEQGGCGVKVEISGSIIDEGSWRVCWSKIAVCIGKCIAVKFIEPRVAGDDVGEFGRYDLFANAGSRWQAEEIIEAVAVIAEEGYVSPTSDKTRVTSATTSCGKSAVSLDGEK